PAAIEVLAGLDRFRSLVVGPGGGTDERSFKAVRTLVAGARVPVVVDADGLNAFGGHLEMLRERSLPTILTPHTGEYERLAGSAVGPDRVAAARELAARSGSVVLLKGRRTVVANPDGRTAINVTGGPQLATAGTGDVLAGVIGALVALGLPAWEAAVAGAWIHGRAASSGTGSGGGLVAGDLVDALPSVLAELAESGV
ncbi:MAG: NAD(P)H-hydrate dehydratase, partial [Chloroflexota bacterium]